MHIESGSAEEAKGIDAIHIVGGDPQLMASALTIAVSSGSTTAVLTL